MSDTIVYDDGWLHYWSVRCVFEIAMAFQSRYRHEKSVPALNIERVE